MPSRQSGPAVSRADFMSPQRTSFQDKVPKRRSYRLRVTNAKDPERLYARVVAHLCRGIAQKVLKVGSGSSITREAVARYLHVPVHQVAQVYARLTREGLMTQERNDGAHDTRRAKFFYGSGTGWAPTYWSLRNEARWHALAGMPAPASAAPALA
jgi:DNA-binding transcriptional MocR family regulator